MVWLVRSEVAMQQTYLTKGPGSAVGTESLCLRSRRLTFSFEVEDVDIGHIITIKRPFKMNR